MSTNTGLPPVYTGGKGPGSLEKGMDPLCQDSERYGAQP